MYRLKLSDASVIDNLRLVGSNFVSLRPVSASDFEGRLNGVTIEYTGTDEKLSTTWPCGYHKHMKLLYCKQIPFETGYYILLDDYTDEELEKMKLDARVTYLEMLSEGEEA